ncbi:alpha/beta hydrolase [Kineobactrum salinum]|uniref:Alpha/beta hydrolase n=1 Tax=Kineobactrum salinum TaxID=2708301 RepID=A0A6C0U0H7_9GAMM|nr:alpha/beta hydrolase [Kineobactrum salinum]QIB65079.1 alpha/beta hydrolase [Kineobactrum salinum]
MAINPPQEKVWLNFDQKALNAAYDQQVYAPNHVQIIKRMEKNSVLMRQRIGEPHTFSYGPSPIEKLFYYPASEPDSPIHIHVHGGAWRQRKAESMLFPAEAFVKAGIGFAIFDFISVEETNGDLNPMLTQICSGLAWLAKNARTLGGDPDRLYLSGFSSGAHLGSAAIVADWNPFGFEKIPYKGAVLISGMYDLHPVRLSNRSEYVRFTDEIVDMMSAQRHVDKFNIPVILSHGSDETPEFKRQTREFAETLRIAGKPVQYLSIEGYNHYELMESLGNPYSPLGSAAIAQTRENS